MSTNTITRTEPLDTTQRCDRCHAQAAAVVAFPNGLDLLLCRHHLNEHRDALGADVTVIVHPLPGE